MFFLLFTGMGDRNPMHNVPFYNKDSEYVEVSDSTTICKRLSPDLLVETYFVVRFWRIKVQLFWEGHKNWKKISQFFWHCLVTSKTMLILVWIVDFWKIHFRTSKYFFQMVFFSICRSVPKTMTLARLLSKWFNCI